MSFKKITPEEITDNPFKLIGTDWMLITAGEPENFNTMTASWGALGFLWARPVAISYVRPSRYTFGFMEKTEIYSLSFFSEKHRQVLNFCGSNSGRDTDKIKETGLIPMTLENGGTSFQEARLVFQCRKLAFQDMDPSLFLNPSIEKHYKDHDYHRVYTGEVLSVLLNSD